jgi:hypothetical protein
MENATIIAQDLLDINFPECKAFGLALRAARKNFGGANKQKTLNKLIELLKNPEAFTEHIIERCG